VSKALPSRQVSPGLRLPGDEIGDCQLFTTRLAAIADQAGVTFLLAVTA